MRVLSEIDTGALCYPAFPLVVRLRKPYKDGVNPWPPPGFTLHGLDTQRSAPSLDQYVRL